MKPVLQSTKNVMKLKLKWKKQKANDWMCQSQKIPSNDCEKAPN